MKGVIMKYFKRLKVYKGSNVYFNPATCEGLSYDWWQVVKKIKGKVVFNWYHYSQSTRWHQYALEALLKQLGIKVHLTINLREGLQAFERQALPTLYANLFGNEITLNNPRVKQSNKDYAAKRIIEIKKDIQTARKLGAKMSQAAIKALKSQLISAEKSRLEGLRAVSKVVSEETKLKKTLLKDSIGNIPNLESLI